MAIRAFLSAFLSTSLPEYSLVIVDSNTYFRKFTMKNPASAHPFERGRCGVLGVLPCSRVFASGRHPAPAADKQQRKGNEYKSVARESRAAEIHFVLQGPGLHTMLAIAPQVFAYCQRDRCVHERVQAGIP